MVLTVSKLTEHWLFFPLYVANIIDFQLLIPWPRKVYGRFVAKSINYTMFLSALIIHLFLCARVYCLFGSEKKMVCIFSNLHVRIIKQEV